MQPIHKDETGTVRFIENRIVTDLLESAKASGIDLNSISWAAHSGKYSDSEVEQFWQLIGYSLSGYLNCQNTVRPSVLDNVFEKMQDFLRNDQKRKK